MDHIAIILLAAGASHRMRGRDKLLEPLGEVALLRERALACVHAAPGRVVVVLPPDAPARREALAGLALDIVKAADAADGLSASIRAGVTALPPGLDGALLVLADMPELTSADLAAVMAAHDPHNPRICRATDADGKPGHPVFFPARLFPALAALQGDTGARTVIAADSAPVTTVPLDGQRATTDLDTPEDWRRWRERHRL